MKMMMDIARRRVGMGVGVVAAAVLLGGCAMLPRIGGEGNTLSAVSIDEQTSLATTYTTAVYRPIDPQTADVYLTDIPVQRITGPKDRLGDAVGSIVHLHVFLVPKAGDTPIDQTACNVTIRHIVLAGTPRGVAASDIPAMGLYAGAGFVQPDDTIGGESLGGGVTGASHRLTRSSPGFRDLIGTGSIGGTFNARRDDALARQIAGRIESLVREMEGVEKGK